MVALVADVPEHNLLRGHVGTIVHIYNKGEAFEVEFVDRQGFTFGLLTLYPEQLLLLLHEAVEKIAS